MSESDNEVARRVLASVLDRLQAGGSLPSNQGAAFDQSSSNADQVVVVVLGQGSKNEAPLARVTNGSHPARAASHPGLEKFELQEPGSNSSAPKTCFMEPDRPCVHSGACETRGY